MLFVCVVELLPTQQFFSHDGTFLSSTKQRIKCLVQGHNTVPPIDPSIPILTLYQLLDLNHVLLKRRDRWAVGSSITGITALCTERLLMGF